MKQYFGYAKIEDLPNKLLVDALESEICSNELGYYLSQAQDTYSESHRGDIDFIKKEIIKRMVIYGMLSL